MQGLPRTKQSYVYNSLREDIQSGRLKPGSRLTLAELQERFGVSHIPIREALRNLEKENLVELSPHASAHVLGISLQEAIWIADLRMTLEPLAVAEAVGNIDEKALKDIKNLIDAIDQFIEPADLNAYVELNNQLHKYLYSLTPNKHLSRMVTELVETANRYRLNTGINNPETLGLWQSEHKELLEALQKGNSEAAKQIMMRHLSHIKDVLMN